MVTNIERYAILISAVYAIAMAVAIWSRKDLEERWLMPLCLLTSVHTAIFYISLIYFKHLFSAHNLNMWSTILRMHSNITHVMLLLFIASRESGLWKH